MNIIEKLYIYTTKRIKFIRIIKEDWRYARRRLLKKIGILRLYEKVVLLFDGIKLRNDDLIVVDCGANVGQSIDLFRQYYGKSVNFHCYEPNTHCFEILKKKTDLDSKIVCFEAGVSSDTGLKKFWISTKNPVNQGSSSVFKTSDSSPISIKVIGLNEILDRANNLGKKVILKLDIEGAEFDIIDELPSLLQNFDVKIAYIEFHPHKFPIKERHTYYNLIKDFKYAMRHKSCVLREWK